MKRNSGKNEAVEYNTPTFSQNVPMRGFSVYNSEGDVYYKNEVERMANELRRELYPTAQTVSYDFPDLPVRREEAKPKKVEKTATMRVFPLVLILILNVLVLAVIALGCFDIGSIGTTIAVFFKETVGGGAQSVSLLDGLFGELAGIGMQSKLDYSMHTDMTARIMLIVFAAGGVLATLFSLVQVIVAIVALATNKKGKKRARFGVVAFFTLIFLFAALIGLIGVKAQVGFGDFCSLTFPKALGEYGLPRVDEGYTLFSGYGLYALIIVPILTMILSACVGKKKK